MKSALTALCLLAAGWLVPAAAQTGVEGAAPAGVRAPEPRPEPAPREPTARPLPVCALAPDDPTRLAVEPCRPAPQRQDRPRRAVPQVIQRMAAPAAPAPLAAVPAPTPVAPPPRPLPLQGCDIGGCRDAAGVRHNGGVGNATVDPGGRLCVRNGAWLQCR